MEKILIVSYKLIRGSKDTRSDAVQALLDKGWTVKLAVPFSQCVSASVGNMMIADKSLEGDYGMTFILEKK